MTKIDKSKPVSERLVMARGSRTQNEVAEAVGIGRSALGMYEKGLRIPRDSVKVRLADYYKIPVQELFF